MRNHTTLSVNTPKEFSFKECLKFLDRSKQEPLHVVRNEKVRKLVKIEGQYVLMELRHKSNRLLEVAILNTLPSESTKQAVQHYVREWFDLDRDLTPFYHLAKTDRLLRKLVRQHQGLRLIRIHDLFQGLCWAIIGQQINLAFAYTLYRRFIESFGESYTRDHQTYWLFPTPEAVAQSTISELRQLQFTGKKAEYILGLAQSMMNGGVSKERLLTCGDTEAIREALRAIRGVGSWTANYVLMRCLGLPRAFPIEDIGLHRAIQKQLKLDRKPTVDEIRELSAGWTDWQAYATFYLYRSLL
ncbi:DNA-3-methyladenine glycosylase [candidate division KSB1 bacterium]|nr:DNA-3-methyladenine glycosylase [candidate division KSB1 bacterium]